MIYYSYHLLHFIHLFLYIAISLTISDYRKSVSLYIQTLKDMLFDLELKTPEHTHRKKISRKR